jgi:hypothetical protein
MTAGPSVSRMVDTAASGTSCPVFELTSNSPNASGVSVEGGISSIRSKRREPSKIFPAKRPTRDASTTSRTRSALMP